MQSWIDFPANLARRAQSRLFFVGGAPRSGTAWRQSLPDSLRYPAAARARGRRTICFSYLKEMPLPAAKFIGIAGNRRDVPTSVRHIFHEAIAGENAVAAKTENTSLAGLHL